MQFLKRSKRSAALDEATDHCTLPKRFYLVLFSRPEQQDKHTCKHGICLVRSHTANRSLARCKMGHPTACRIDCIAHLTYPSRA
ncbi:hypothetical protein DUNSADRAFT_13971 [Dunaliella salina]|uniref:Encoded protein n=1 Tax=Dunaliella salina TaxID=3046 RepID=A0ABQ7G8C8_DUNSA|nr:hypothetical protein DUNSADRAFT_13971 [Dunaliella salina]|eukprot:KAF5830823.1 hypothetical protein DUNSADRAFT_13971 [Dunaliella salina]